MSELERAVIAWTRAKVRASRDLSTETFAAVAAIGLAEYNATRHLFALGLELTQKTEEQTHDEQQQQPHV